MTQISATTSLRQSAAYQWRLPITIVSLVLGSAGALFSRPWIAPHSVEDWYCQIVGWLVLVCGIGLRGWSSHQISGRKRKSIVDTGPYAACRNPLYVGTFIIALSQVCFLLSTTYVLALIAPVALYVWGVVPAEERHLSHQLGEEYLAYCRETPRWWPHWSPKILVTSPLADRASFQREATTLFWWFFLPFISLGICHVRSLPAFDNWHIFP